MPRARLLKPGFFKNEDLARLSPYHRLCYSGLWTLADREGRLEDRPERIKAELFPYDKDVTVTTVTKYVADLAKWHFVVQYSDRSRHRYLSIPAFPKHQTPHYREPASRIPPPPTRKRNGQYTISESLGPSLGPAQGQPQASLADPVTGDPVHKENLPLIPSLQEGTPPEACEYCGATPEQTGWALEWDHVIPKRAGGSDGPRNRVWACHVCNQAKQGRLFDSIDAARAWLHTAYWRSNRQRWIDHRQVAFGGKPPKGYAVHASGRAQKGAAKIVQGGTNCPHDPPCTRTSACIKRTVEDGRRTS